MIEIASGCFLVDKRGRELRGLTAVLQPARSDSAAVYVFDSAEAAHALGPRGERSDVTLFGTRVTTHTFIRANVLAACAQCPRSRVDQLERGLAAL